MKILMIPVFLLSLSAAVCAAPSIEFSQTRADLGFIGSGDKVEYTFEFTNSGDEELIIRKITSS